MVIVNHIMLLSSKAIKDIKRGELHLVLCLSATLCIAKQNLSNGVNVVCEGYPRTLPLARVKNSLLCRFVPLVSASKEFYTVFKIDLLRFLYNGFGVLLNFCDPSFNLLFCWLLESLAFFCFSEFFVFAVA